MVLNLNNHNELIQKQKKKNNFSTLICLKSHVKFKADKELLLVKINNNISLSFKRKKSINLKINDNKIFLFSKSLKDLNLFTKNLSPFSTYISFL